MEDMEELELEGSYPDEVPETETEEASGNLEPEDSPVDDETETEPENPEPGQEEPDAEAGDQEEEEPETDTEDSDAEEPKQESGYPETGMPITVSGNAVVFPDGYDASAFPVYSSGDSDAVVQAVAEQTDVLRGGFFGISFICGAILGVLLIHGFRLRRV